MEWGSWCSGERLVGGGRSGTVQLRPNDEVSPVQDPVSFRHLYDGEIRDQFRLIGSIPLYIQKILERNFLYIYLGLDPKSLDVTLWSLLPHLGIYPLFFCCCSDSSLTFPRKPNRTLFSLSRSFFLPTGRLGSLSPRKGSSEILEVQNC